MTNYGCNIYWNPITTKRTKDAIEGIDAVAEAYPEAVAALKNRFDCCSWPNRVPWASAQGTPSRRATLGAFHSKISEISGPKLNGTVKSFRKFRNTFWVHPLWRNFRDYRKFCVPFARDVGFSLLNERELTWRIKKAIMAAGRRVRYGSLFATLQRNSSICLSGKIAGRPDKLSVGIRPVCIIS